MKYLSKWIVTLLVTVTAGLAVGQANEIRIAHIYGKTGPVRGLCEADAGRPDDGPRVRHRRQDGGARPQDRGHREGRPAQARRRQVACWPRRTATTRSTSRSARPARAWRSRCCRSPRSTRRSCSSSRRWPIRSPATSGTGTSSAPAATRRRTRSRTRSPLGKAEHLHRDPGAGLRLRPRRRQGVQGRAGRHRRGDRARGIRAAADHRLHRARRSACSTRSRTSGPQGDLDHLGRRGNPFKIADLNPGRYGIEIAPGGNILPAMAAYKELPGMEGATYYYYGIPKNPVNEWLVEEH